jgi:hypothetical protein
MATHGGRALPGATAGGSGVPTTQRGGTNRQEPPDKPTNAPNDSPLHHLFSRLRDVVRARGELAWRRQRFPFFNKEGRVDYPTGPPT